MMDYTKVPATLINKYLWDLAKGSVAGVSKVPDTVFGLDVATYTYQPFFPVSENAGTDGETPFITYQSMPRIKYDSNYWILKERMIYTVVAPMPNILYICNFINGNLNKIDVAAASINDHIKDPAVIFDKIVSFSVNLPEESTKFNSVSPRYQAEIIVDFDYRRSDL
jgi:hypothetical protein